MDKSKAGAGLLLWTFIGFAVIAAILCAIQNYVDRDKELCLPYYTHVDLSDPSLGIQREIDDLREAQRQFEKDRDFWTDEDMKSDPAYQPTC